jgi:hypothetical protein
VEQVLTSGGGRIDGADSAFTGKSAASWPAIFAGTFVALAASVVLATLGSGLGFASISPWPGHGVSATTFTVTTAIWLIVTQWVSAGLGGYIAGRLRTKWVGTHTHEVFFRDTAHGLITWSIATVFVAAMLAGSVTSLVGGGMHALGGAASAGAHATGGAPGAGPGSDMGGPGGGAGMMQGGMPGGPSPALAYDIDKLFRPTPGMTAPSGGNASGEDNGDPRIEAVYIAMHAMGTGNVPEADRAYLAQRVSEQTGTPPAEAQRRVDEFISATLAAETKMKAAADKARKAAAEASIYLALSLLVGAFIASVSAALGGRLRDEHP